MSRLKSRIDKLCDKVFKPITRRDLLLARRYLDEQLKAVPKTHNAARNFRHFLDLIGRSALGEADLRGEISKLSDDEPLCSYFARLCEITFLLIDDRAGYLDRRDIPKHVARDIALAIEHYKTMSKSQGDRATIVVFAQPDEWSDQSIGPYLHEIVENPAARPSTHE